MRKLRLFLCGRMFPFALILLSMAVLFALLSAYLPGVLAPVAAVERLFSLAAALLVTAEPSPEAHKVSKLVLILLLPWTGAAACLLFLSRAPRNTDFAATMSVNPPSNFAPARLSETLSKLPACSIGSAEYFPVGREMYERLLGDLRNAKKFVWLEYYIVAEGIFLSDLLSVLGERAESGVDVRLIFDGFGSALTLPKGYEREFAARGIKTLCFRPVRFPSRNAGRRDHRKLAVIDGEIAYTGGINLADEYIGEKIRFGHWKDTAVRATGSVALAFAELFARTWNAGMPAFPVTLPKRKPANGGNCAVIADGADETELRAGMQLLLMLFTGARSRLYVNTPYLAPDLPLLRAMQGAALAGVDVRLMIPHIPDKKLPFLLTRSYAAELERAGVQVREYTDGFLHAKSVLSDQISFVSSYNLDFRSLYLQAECGICARSKPLAEALGRDFLAAWETGTPLGKLRPAAALFARLLRLIAPLM